VDPALGGKSAVARTMYHGTSVESAVAFLNGAGLDVAAAVAQKIDGKVGFFLATHVDDAAYFALRRSGAILEFQFSEHAVRQLGGLETSPLGALGGYGYFLGGEVRIAAGMFERFNGLLAGGHIRVKLHKD
jgi:hypothetical protein